MSSRNVRVRPDCSYRSRVALRATDPLRRGTLSVRVRFQGNGALLPRAAPVRTVHAGPGR
jgi:hypothetical protein